MKQKNVGLSVTNFETQQCKMCRPMSYWSETMQRAVLCGVFILSLYCCSIRNTALKIM